MNRFEAIARFEASLASVAPEQRRPLVAAFNAAMATAKNGPSPAEKNDAAYLNNKVLVSRTALIFFGYGGLFLGSSGIISLSAGLKEPGWPIFFSTVTGLGLGALIATPGWTQLNHMLINFIADIGESVDDWLDFDEPEPAEPEQRRRVFDPQEGRTLVSKYDFSNDELLILANLRPGTPITRPALEAAGFTGLTGYIGTDTRLAVLQGELERMGWANRVGKELQMSRAGIAAAHAHAE